VSGPQIRVRTREDLARQRRRRGWDHERVMRSARAWPCPGVLGIELADEAIRLADLPAARHRTIAVLGREQTAIPPEALALLDVAVEIPMIGMGASLNVAVAGSLVVLR
jgi:SpoU rRNA Methylase family